MTNQNNLKKKFKETEVKANIGYIMNHYETDGYY